MPGFFKRIAAKFKKPPVPLHQETVQVKPSVRVNPKTGESIMIDPHSMLVMKRGEEIKQERPPAKPEEPTHPRPAAKPEEHHPRPLAKPEEQPKLRPPKQEEHHDRLPQKVETAAAPRPAVAGKPESGVGGRGGSEPGGTPSHRDYGNLIVARENLNQFPKKDHISEQFPQYVDKSKKFFAKQHQIDAVNLAIEKYGQGAKGMVLADGTGAGKSIQILMLAAHRAKNNESCLIVTENDDIITGSFQEDAERLGGVELVKDLDTPTPGKIGITTYSRLAKLKDAKWDQVIFDEAHNLREKSSTKSLQGKELIANSKHVMLASATPMDKPEHIHYLAASLGIPATQVLHDIGYRSKVKKGGKMVYRRGSSPIETAEKLGSFMDGLTKMGLMVKREVSLANVGFKSHPIALSDEQRAGYGEMTKKMLADVKNAEENDENPGMAKSRGLMRIRRYLEEIKMDHAFSAAMQSLKSGRQVVIFGTRVGDAELVAGKKSPGTIPELERRFIAAGIPVSTMYGESKDTKAIDNFQSGDTKVFLGTYQSAGTGINLQDKVGGTPRDQIHMTPPFSANSLIQAIGRTNRMDSKSQSRVLNLTTDTDVDRWNKAILEGKLKTTGAAVSGDYAKLSVNDIEKASNMDDEQAYEFLFKKGVSPDFRLPVSSSPQPMKSLFMIKNAMRGGATVPTEKESAPTPKKPLTSPVLNSFNDLKQHVPAMPGGQMPDLTVGFGPHKGKKLSELEPKAIIKMLKFASPKAKYDRRFIKTIKWIDPQKMIAKSINSRISLIDLIWRQL